MPYMGNQPATSFSSVSYQDLTGSNGTSFTLDYPVGNAQEIDVFVNNVRQEPGVAYTANGTELITTGTISISDDFYVVFSGKAQQSATHPANQDLDANNGTFTGNVSVTGNVDVGNSLLVDTIKEGTGTNTGFTIDSNGRFLTPNQPAFMAYLSSDQAITSNTWTKVNLNAETFDRNGDFDATTNYRFDVPVDGIYHFTTNINFTTDSSSGGYVYTAVRIDGGGAILYTAGIRIVGSAVQSDNQTVGSMMLDLNAGQYVEMWGFQQSGSTPSFRGITSGSPRTYMCGYLIG